MLTLLRWGLIGLLYLFFFRVLQVTWIGSVAPMPSRRRAKQVRGPTQAHHISHLVGIQPPEFAGREFVLDTEITIGRAPSCTIAVDDSYLSQAHVRVYQQPEGTVVEDLGSTNGTYLNQSRIADPVLATQGDILQLGGIVLELR